MRRPGDVARSRRRQPALGMSAMPATLFIIRTRRSSPAAFLNGRAAFCCAGALSNHATALWTLPAGFMENGESAVTAAVREALEEANAVVENPTLYGLYSLLHVSQVYLMFRGQLRDGAASPGEETLEVGLFAEAEIPWEQLAFTVVRETLRQYFTDRPTGVFNLHVGDIIRESDHQFRIQRYT